jgi:two-component system sensor histidine kinase/response regulator
MHFRSAGFREEVSDQMGKTILVIDDNKDGRAILKDLFASAGYVSVTAKNGVQALRKMKEVVPALMVLDLRMPEMDGWTFEKAVRKHPALVQIPLVVVTACLPEEIGDTLRYDALFHKPYRPDALLAKVQELMARGPKRLSLIKKG